MHFHDFPQFKKQQYNHNNNTNNSAVQDFTAILHEFCAERLVEQKKVQQNFLNICICCYFLLLFLPIAALN